MVYLHGIPACIQHHFNPSGLDFSGGPINLEEIFRLTDLIDEDSPGRLIHRVNSLGALAVSGKKKRRKVRSNRLFNLSLCMHQCDIR